MGRSATTADANSHDGAMTGAFAALFQLHPLVAVSWLWTLIVLIAAVLIVRRFLRQRTPALAWSAGGFGLLGLSQVTQLISWVGHFAYLRPRLAARAAIATDQGVMDQANAFSTGIGGVGQALAIAGIVILAAGARRGVDQRGSS